MLATSTAVSEPIINQAFYADMIAGLSQQPKTLPCKWFYDETGSHLFEAITRTPEYYLTRTETRMLTQAASDLSALLPNLTAIIEPGSGSSIKTRLLLSELAQLTHYYPMDISADFLKAMSVQLRRDYPALHIRPIVGDFSQMAQVELPANLAEQRLVFFPGSTIGNFSPTEAKKLLQAFHHLAGADGQLLIGVDGTQHEATLLSAYDDAEGVTAAFNRNVLVRANRELNTDFSLDDFAHQVRWSADQHRIEMHLSSLAEQSVYLDEHVFHFAKGETIHTESCHKYPQALFESLAASVGWTIAHRWLDAGDTDFQLFLLKPA